MRRLTKIAPSSLFSSTLTEIDANCARDSGGNSVRTAGMPMDWICMEPREKRYKEKEGNELDRARHQQKQQSELRALSRLFSTSRKPPDSTPSPASA